MTDRLTKITTAAAVITVAAVAAVISYQHAYDLVRVRGESGLTARLLPFTVDGLIWAASMVVLDASRRGQPVPWLAAWSLGTGIVAAVGANLAHGIGHGPAGAVISAWPALALAGSFELLMMLIRTGRGGRAGATESEPHYRPAPPLAQEAPLELPAAPGLEQTVRARYEAGQSQRAIARELDIARTGGRWPSGRVRAARMGCSGCCAARTGMWTGSAMTSGTTSSSIWAIPVAC